MNITGKANCFPTAIVKSAKRNRLQHISFKPQTSTMKSALPLPAHISMSLEKELDRLIPITQVGVMLQELAFAVLKSRCFTGYVGITKIIKLYTYTHMPHLLSRPDTLAHRLSALDAQRSDADHPADDNSSVWGTSVPFNMSKLLKEVKVHMRNIHARSMILKNVLKNHSLAQRSGHTECTNHWKLPKKPSVDSMPP